MSDSAKNSSKNVKLPIFDVNLLIRKGEAIRLHIRLLRWLLSSGRYIVIFVEIIVIAAFIMRYKLDGELADLQQQIGEQAKFIQSLSADETAIRQTQFQLTTIKQIRRDNADFPDILFKIATITPTRISLNNISFNRPSSTAPFGVSISGFTPSNIELSVFIKALQNDPTFTDITLTNISFDQQTTFTITGTLTSKGGQKS